MILAVAGLLLVAGSLCAGDSPIPRERLISFWSGEAQSSGARLDEIGSNHLARSSAESTAPGKIGTATVFSGTDLGTKLSPESYASSINSVGRDISYAGWIRFNSVAAEQTIASRWGGWAPGREFRLYLDSSAKVLKLDWANDRNAASRTVADSQSIAVGQWYFVAFGRSDAASEIWLTVTPDDAKTARKRGTTSKAATNPAAHNASLFFGSNDKANRMDGLWNQWGIYACTLTPDEVDWLFNAGAGRSLADFVYVQTPTLGYFNNFEQEGHTAGRISYEDPMEGTAIRSTEQARSGSYSLKVIGSWGQIQVFNNSNTDYWCTTEECKVSVDIYVTDFIGGSMLFQMDGKSNQKDLDTNEGLGVMYYNDKGHRGFSLGSKRTSGYDLPLNTWVHMTYLRKRNQAAPGNNTELYADGKLIVAIPGSADPKPAPYVAKTWHHISLGNDRLAKPTLYMDNFSVRPIARLNDPPEVEIGPERTASLSTPLSLKPTVIDVDMNPLTCTWSKSSGPGNVTFSAAQAVETEATFSAAGTYVLQLAVSDGTETTTDAVTVTVGGR